MNGIKNKHHSIVDAVVLIGVLTCVSKGLGFFREMIIAAIFGASAAMDAFNIADMMISMSVNVLQAVFLLSFLPVYNGLLAKDSDKANRFANTVLNTIIIVLLVFTVFISCFLEQIVSLIVPGFSAENISLTVSLAEIMLPSITLSLLVAFFSAIQQSEHRFFLPAVIGIPYNFLLIGTIYFFHMSLGIFSLGYGIVIAVLSTLLIQFGGICHSHYNYKMEIHIPSQELIRMLSLSIPLIIGVSSAQVNLLVDRMLASHLTAGSISALAYANKTFMVFITVFAIPIATVVFPQLSQYYAVGKKEYFNATLRKSIAMLLFVMVPIVFLLVFWSDLIVRALFYRGAFDQLAAANTSIALSCFSGAVLGIALTEIMNRSFYAVLNTRLPMLVSICGIVLNIILNIILVGPYKHGGLAFATSISTLFTGISLFYFLYKKLLFWQMNSFLRFAGKIVMLSVIINMFFRELLRYINVWEAASPVFLLMCIIILETMVYLFMGIRLHIEESQLVVKKIKKSLNSVLG